MGSIFTYLWDSAAHERNTLGMPTLTVCCIYMLHSISMHYAHIESRVTTLQPQGFNATLAPLGSLQPQGLSATIAALGSLQPQGLSATIAPLGSLQPQGLSATIAPLGFKPT